MYPRQLRNFDAGLDAVAGIAHDFDPTWAGKGQRGGELEFDPAPFKADKGAFLPINAGLIGAHFDGTGHATVTLADQQIAGGGGIGHVPRFAE